MQNMESQPKAPHATVANIIEWSNFQAISLPYHDSPSNSLDHPKKPLNCNNTPLFCFSKPITLVNIKVKSSEDHTSTPSTVLEIRESNPTKQKADNTHGHGNHWIRSIPHLSLYFHAILVPFQNNITPLFFFLFFSVSLLHFSTTSSFLTEHRIQRLLNSVSACIKKITVSWPFVFQHPIPFIDIISSWIISFFLFSFPFVFLSIFSLSSV